MTHNTLIVDETLPGNRIGYRVECSCDWESKSTYSSMRHALMVADHHTEHADRSR